MRMFLNGYEQPEKGPLKIEIERIKNWTEERTKDIKESNIKNFVRNELLNELNNGRVEIIKNYILGKKSQLLGLYSAYLSNKAQEPAPIQSEKPKKFIDYLNEEARKQNEKNI